MLFKSKFDRNNFKTAASMAWPAIIESFFVAFAGLIDSLMVSSLGSYAVAAVGLTTQPKFIGLSLFFATNVAISALVARRYGEKRRDLANRILYTAMIFVVVAAIILSIVLVCAANPIISLCGSTEETHDGAVAYFQIIMGGMIFNIISMVINAAQRGAGNTKIAMYTNTISSIVNIIGNYLLIGGHLGFPKLGIRGAALATVLGTVVGCTIRVMSLFRKDSFLSIPYIIKEGLWKQFESVKIILKLSSSTFVEQILMRIGFMSTAVMAADMGTAAMAAHQVGMNALSLSFSFGDGMQAAAVALIGQSLGSKEPQEAKRHGMTCEKVALVMAVFMSLFYLFCGKWLFGLFFAEAHIVEIGVRISRILIVIVLFQICQVVFTGALRGAGDVVYTMISSTISVTFVRTAVSYICCYIVGWGIYGIWMGIVADQFCRLMLSGIRFRSGKWMKIKI